MHSPGERCSAEANLVTRCRLLFWRRRVLDLSFNKLVGTVPLEFGGMTSLTTLRLKNNKLFGPVPQAFAAFHALTYGAVGADMHVSLC